MRRLTASIEMILVLLLSGPLAPDTKAYLPRAQTVPTSAVIDFVLSEAPGLSTRKNKWEISCELRLSNEAELWEARKKEKTFGSGEVRSGEILKTTTIKKSLESSDSQTIHIAVPFSASTLQALRDEPRERVKTTTSNRTPENLKLAREQEVRSRVFLLYAVVSVYDATLEQTITIPVSRAWGFTAHPDARFEVKINIHKDGSYGVKSSEPKSAQ